MLKEVISRGKHVCAGRFARLGLQAFFHRLFHFHTSLLLVNNLIHTIVILIRRIIILPGRAVNRSKVRQALKKYPFPHRKRVLLWNAIYGVGVGVGALAASWAVCGMPAMTHSGDHVDILLVEQLGGRHLGDGLAGLGIDAGVPGDQLEQQALRIAGGDAPGRYRRSSAYPYTKSAGSCRYPCRPSGRTRSSV